MIINISILILFQIISLIISEPICKQYYNNCEICNPLTNLCVKCESDNYFPNEEGGCTPKCIIGKNYCNLCNSEEKLCIECELGYYPDQIGSCSLIENCKISSKGKCSKCIDDYILIGKYEDQFQICKNKNSEEFKNCNYINSNTGLCEECEEGYFLTEGNSKCIKTENCYESTFGICNQCNEGFYLNKKSNECKEITDLFYYCKQTLDEKNCDECNFGYYMGQDEQCSLSINCGKTDKGKCIECSSGYILTRNNVCTQEPNCYNADKDTGLCNSCVTSYYIDLKDRKCKSNRENNELKFCRIYENNECTGCEGGYFLDPDLKCASSRNCLESNLGICKTCKEGFHLISNDKCSNIENCKYAETEKYPCDECVEGYYFNTLKGTCEPDDDIFKNCKIATFYSDVCTECKDNYYLNKTDLLCYDNTQDEQFYHCKFTDKDGIDCGECYDGYFVNSGDKKCGKVKNCKFSENEERCLECNEYFCLNIKDGFCYDNDFMEKYEDKIYIACNYTNKEGTACEKCLEGYEVGENGYCIDVTYCEKKENGICVKCKDDEYGNFFCANSMFGCLETFIAYCLNCEDFSNLYACTEYFTEEEE